MRPWPAGEIHFVHSLLVLTGMTVVLRLAGVLCCDSTMRLASMSDTLAPGKQYISDANLTFQVMDSPVSVRVCCLTLSADVEEARWPTGQFFLCVL